MTFTKWFNEIADMPTKRENGDWYDAETGINFSATIKTISTIKTDSEKRYSSCKVSNLKSMVSRFISSQKISIERNSDKDIFANIAVVESYNTLMMKSRVLKSELIELIEMNSKASRILNNQIK